MFSQSQGRGQEQETIPGSDFSQSKLTLRIKTLTLVYVHIGIRETVLLHSTFTKLPTYPKKGPRQSVNIFLLEKPFPAKPWVNIIHAVFSESGYILFRRVFVVHLDLNTNAWEKKGTREIDSD